MNSSRSGREIDSALTKKEFEKTKDGDHVRYYFYDQQTGAILSQTKMSHGVLGQTIGAPLISQMARQLRLTKTQFLALIDCTLDEDSYRQILQNEEE
ncbi:MAG: hypothetical protein LBI05_01550 [Planctomycetaceae bacterium]|jgi:hypothetical protein|nr:hypothetical protein [Planctomycetaceae bacterium]